MPNEPTILTGDGKSLNPRLVDQTIRELWRRLRIAESAAGSTTNQSTDAASIRNELQASGSAPLNVTNLPGLPVSNPGTVTIFSSGNLSPLFTTTVATATSTPALSFAKINQASNVVFAGPASGAAAAPTFRNLVGADFPLLDSADHPYILLPIPATLNGLNFNQTMGAANEVQVFKFLLPLPLIVTRITAYIGIASAGGLFGVGVYSSAGAKLVASGAQSTTATGAIEATVGAVTIGPGWYWLAVTMDNTTGAFRSANNDATADAVLNQSFAQKGTAANASVAGVLPATLGSITGSTAIATAYVKLQTGNI
jgi:hypothetical protein